MPDTSVSLSTIRQMRSSDLPDAMRLVRESGWNQLPSDWERLLSMEPAGCLALECDGRLAATATVICYGKDLAWIGMVLTAIEFRRRGFARRLLHQILEYARQQGISAVKLDATDQGAELYRDCGFIDECEVQRWRRIPDPAEAGREETEDLTYLPDPAYDKVRFGTDRGALLAQLAELGAVGLPGEGYAMSRPGSVAAYFGPCVASSPKSAAKFLKHFLARQPNEPFFWDLLPDNKQAVEVAQEFGFALNRRLVRMVWKHGHVAKAPAHPDIFAIAGFELG